VLLTEPVHLAEDAVADAVEKAWGARPTHNVEDEISFIENPTAVMTSVQIRGNIFAILSIPEPYTLDRDWYVRDETPPELLTAWQQHRAWLSVDLVAAAPDSRSEDLYGLIGKLLAELVPEASAADEGGGVGGDDGAGGLAIFRPGKRHAIGYDDETRTLLRRTNPLQVVTGPLTSLVLLLTAPRHVETPELLALIKRAWNVDLGSDPALSDFAAAPKPPYGFIQFQGIRFGLIAPEAPYVQDLAAAAADIADIRTRDAVAAHKAWLSIDLIEAPVGVSRAQVYRHIARLIAELVDERTLLVFAPELQRAVPVTPDLARKLRAEDPLAMLTNPEHPPIFDITPDDPRMAAAVAEARRRLPQFIAAFAARKADQRFALKKRFVDGPHAEFMWVRVTAITGPAGSESLTGTLDNDPYRVHNIKCGAPVACAAADIIDWLYTDSGAVQGNFTGAVLAAEQAT
jgi:uncharacterized protein YegJ (DUF2314 family)